MAFVIDAEAIRRRATLTPARAANPARTEADKTTQDVYTVRLLGAGCMPGDATRLAKTLQARAATDDRVMCAAECSAYRAGRCSRYRWSGMPPELGDLAFVLQRCHAFIKREDS